MSADTQRTSIHNTVKVRICRDNAFFGPGPYRLLEAIGKCGTVSGACELTGMSYSKGRSLIRSMEKELGFPLVERTPGGTGGGSAKLTAAGIDFMRRYAEYAKAVSDYADSIFANYFENLE